MNPQLINAFQVIAAAVISGAFAVWVARSGARSTEKGKELENDLEWRKQLMDEIKELKLRVENLEKERDHRTRMAFVMGDFLDSLSAFVMYGRQGPYPIPPDEAGDYFNIKRWIAIKADHDSHIE